MSCVDVDHGHKTTFKQLATVSIRIFYNVTCHIDNNMA